MPDVVIRLTVSILVLIYLCSPTTEHDNFKISLTEHPESLNAARIISNFLVQYFSGKNFYISIFTDASTNSQFQFQRDLFTDLAKGLELNVSYAFFNISMNKPRLLSRLRLPFNLFFVDNLDEVVLQVRQSKYLRQFIAIHAWVILTDINESKTEEKLQTLFQAARESHFSNLLTLAFDREKRIWSLVSYSLFRTNCSALSHRVIETFTRENFTNRMNASFRSVFPNEIRNMNKCPVHVAVAEVEPYVIIRRGKRNPTFDGIDVRIVKEIAMRMNFTPKFLLPRPGDDRGIIFKNGSATGAMDRIVNGEANLAIGIYLLTQDRSIWFSPTVTYMQDRIGFAIRVNYITPSSLNHLMGPLNYNAWLFIYATLCAAVVFLLLTKGLETDQRTVILGGKLYRTPILNALYIAIGGSIDNPRMKYPQYFGTFARTLTMLWILLFMFIRAWYEGGLFTFFHQPPMFSKCDSFEKVLAFKCKIIAPKSGVNHLVGFNASISQFVVCNNSALNCASEMFKGKTEIDVAFVHEQTKKYFNHLNAPNLILDYTKDQVFQVAPVFFFEKNSILRHSFDHFLRLYDQSGLTKNWIDYYTSEKKLTDHRTNPQLKIRNITALLTTCKCLYALSTVIFVMELLASRCSLLRRGIEFITY